MRAFLDPRRVEYLEWKSRYGTAAATSETGPDEPPPQHFLTVALEGAAVLDDQGPVMTKIFAQTRQFMLTEQAQPDLVAVVDYDDSSSFLISDERRGLLQWCDSSGYGQCQTVSRFRV